MELELKHLAAYLPYGLNCYGQGEVVDGTEYDDKPIPKLLTIVGTEYNQVYVEGIRETNTEQIHIADCIPILRPLSILDKEIEVNGERFIPMVKLAKIEFPNVDFTIENDYCKGRLYVGVVIEFVIEDEIPFYKEYHNNIFGHSKNENYDDMYMANLKPSEIREKLCEWHFDIFGLIDAGLAVEMEDSHGR